MKFLFTDTNPMITHGLARTLLELGKEVQIIDLGAALSQSPDYLGQCLDSFHPDLVFSQGGWGRFGKHVFSDLRRRRIPHVFWGSEDPLYFDSLSLPMASNSKLVFTTAAECIPKYQARGIKAHLMMFACTPSFHHQVHPDPGLSHDCIFIGNNYGQFSARFKGMEIILKPLMAQGADLKIYGLDWWLDRKNPFSIDPQFYGGHLSYEEMRTAYSSARIVLGLHSVNTSPTMMSMRTFEALGCGAFHLTQWTPAIERFFVNHRHLVWSKSPEETEELLKHYLPRPEERMKIARAGQAEVYARHTYQHRAEELLNIIRANIPAMVSNSSGYCYSAGRSGHQNWYPMKVKRGIIKHY
ncbi:MAG: glycosyltransferase [Syntrophomonadaceae bacterium]|nr:glycosyltransferase [Syntrophomonadaceae bacterium]